MSTHSSPTQEDRSQPTTTSTLEIDLPSLALPSIDSSSSPWTNSRFFEPRDGIPEGIPLEILERILRYTFLPRTEPSPSSDPYHLRNTTHLLLVSKAFRELCLPIFFHNLTIARPSDYVTFFNPTDGIFVVGEEGRRRWSFVQVLGFGFNVEPPARYPTSDDKSWMVSLVPPVGAQFGTVVLFDRQTCDPDLILDQDTPDQEIVSRFKQDKIAQDYFAHQILDEYEDSPYFANGGRQVEDWVQTTYGREFERELSWRLMNEALSRIRAPRRRFYGQLVPSQTLHLSYSTSADVSNFLHLASMVAEAREALLAIVYVYRPPGPNSSDPSILPSCLHSLRRRFQVLFLMLIGYSTENRPCFLEQFHEVDVDSEPTWRYVGKGNSAGAVALVPAEHYHLALRDGELYALSEEEELAWRGIEPAPVVDENEEAVETQAS